MYPNIKKLCHKIAAARIAKRLVPPKAKPVAMAQPVVQAVPVKSAADETLLTEVRGLRSDLREFMARATAPTAPTAPNTGDNKLVQ